ALATGSPIVQGAWPDNLAGHSSRDHDAGASRNADVVVDTELRVGRVAGMPMETRGGLAWPDGPTNTLTVVSATQVPFEVRTASGRWLQMDEGRIRVLAAPDVGGGFGVKGHVYPEEVLVAAVARRLDRPVKWIETRREHLMASAHERDQHHHARLRLTAEGTL